MLPDTKVYRKLQHNPTADFTVALDRLLDEGIHLSILDMKQNDFFLGRDPISPIFHALPKTHKQVFPPHLRPVIAGIGSLFERLSSWLENLLQPLVYRLPGFIQDTKELLRALDGKQWLS